MKARALTESQRELFAARFYEIEDIGLDDQDTSSPWGCPWYHGSDPMLEGDTIEEMAENFFAENRDEILKEIEDYNSFLKSEGFDDDRN